MARTKRTKALAVAPKGATTAAFRLPAVTPMAPTLLQPAVYNPRTISTAKFEALKESIRSFGLVRPLVVQRSSPKYGANVIVGGHQTLKAVQALVLEAGGEMRMPELPCVVLDLDDREAMTLNVALNNIEGEFDVRKLSEVLTAIHKVRKIGDDDARRMGMSGDDASKLLKLSEAPKLGAAAPPATFGRSITLSLEFDDLATRDAVKEKFVELSELEGKKSGAIVFELLSSRKK